MHQVVEPPGVRRATQAMFVVFAGVGVFASVVILGAGEGWFGLVFGGMFIGIPWIIHRASKGPGVPGFTLTSDGILGAADDEERFIPWGEVDRLAWRGTGLTVNGAACLALHAELVDGRSVRVTTYTARRGREVDEVEQQVEESGLLPSGVGFGDNDENRPRPDGDVLASVARTDTASGRGGPKSWSELPPPAKVAAVMFLLIFLGPFLTLFAIIPVLLVAFAGPVGWVLIAGTIAVVARVLIAVAHGRRSPVLSCSFTIEGVVADNGDGLTVPWDDDAGLRIDPTVTDDGPLVEGGTGRAWMVHLERPGASPLRLSPVLTSRAQVRGAVHELAAAKGLGLIPVGVPLALPLDLPEEVTRRLAARWDAA